MRCPERDGMRDLIRIRWGGRWSPSSRLLLIVTLSLILVSGSMALLSSTSYFNWIFATSYNPWRWRYPVTPRMNATSTSNDDVFNSSSSSSYWIQPPVGEKEGMWNSTISTTAGMNRSPQSFVPNSVINGSPPVGASSRKGKYYSNNFNLERIEASLGLARAAIRAAAASSSNHGSNQMQRPQQQDHPHLDNYLPNGPMYRKATAFLRSYLEMEKQLKVFIYEEGEPPVFHYGPCKHAYAIEGLFIQSMEVSQFRTWDPEEAHVFFLPFSVTMITQVVYVVGSHDWSSMKNTAMDYVNLIAAKYPYWNRSLGADHFILSCHDWAPEISFAVPNLYNNSIRALCNANTSEQFNPARDVSIPEIHLPTGTTEGILGGPPPSRRPILVFYAGGVHGPIRPVLLEHWENKDPDVQVHQYLPENVSYYGMMRKSKYCICPSGYEVASPRMVEALYMGCVPVLIKDHYVIPFSDVLNWKTFSVIVAVEDIPNLKRILMGISSSQYLKMQRRGLQMRRHFEVNSPPKRFDVFHMILHSIWLRRLNVRVHEH